MALLVILTLLLGLAPGVPALAEARTPMPVVAERRMAGRVLAPTGAPPREPSLNTPPDSAQEVSNQPLLGVRVSDPDLDALELTFYGREIGPEPGSAFTVVALPDTQMLSQSYPELFLAQTQWIVENREALNIVYVAHEGDIVNAPDDRSQWMNADAAMSLLEDPATTGLADGIPYSVVPGNHDEPGASYNRFFGPERYQGRAYYGGNYPEGSNKNNYVLFSAGGMDFIAVSVEYESPAEGALEWADSLLQTYSDRRAIVTTHSILDYEGAIGRYGQQVYDALKDNPNLFLMLCGHKHGEARRSLEYEGRTVHILLADYQSDGSGGMAFLRRMEFSPQDDQIRVYTYSPWLDEFNTDEESQFVLDYDMPDTAPIQELGKVSGVQSDSDVYFSWSGLEPGTTYEWYVEVSDGAGTTTSPTWQFTTAVPGPHNLELAAEGSGSVSRNPDLPAYSHEEVVQLTASPAEGWHLSGWSGDLSGRGNPASVFMDADKSVTAIFSDGKPTASIEVQVAASLDDAEERLDQNTVAEKGADLELGEDSAPQIVGLRFAGIELPQGAEIVEAYVQFAANETEDRPTDLVFTGQASDDAAPFDDTDGYLSNQPRTAASVAWNDVAPWTTVQETHQSADLSPILQEIVDQSGWVPGNALALFITGQGRRVAESYDGDPALAPVLHITYLASE